MVITVISLCRTRCGVGQKRAPCHHPSKVPHEHVQRSNLNLAIPSNPERTRTSGGASARERSGRRKVMHGNRHNGMDNEQNTETERHNSQGQTEAVTERTVRTDRLTETTTGREPESDGTEKVYDWQSSTFQVEQDTLPVSQWSPQPRREDETPRAVLSHGHLPMTCPHTRCPSSTGSSALCSVRPLNAVVQTSREVPLSTKLIVVTSLTPCKRNMNRSLRSHWTSISTTRVSYWSLPPSSCEGRRSTGGR